VADDVAADEQRCVDRHQREVPVADGENTGNVVPLLLSSRPSCRPSWPSGDDRVVASDQFSKTD